MNKTLIIIQREFMTRVKKKSFILLTILDALHLRGTHLCAALARFD